MFTRKAFLQGLGGIALLGLVDPAKAAADRTLRAGVTKVKLTPSVSALASVGGRLDGSVAQDIFARIIVLGNGAGERLALITADLPRFPRANDLLRQIAAAHGIAPATCVLAVTGNRQAESLVTSGSASAIQTAMTGAIVNGVGAAIEAMRPARLALDIAASNINAPFGRVTAAGFAEMPDFARFADNRLAVLRIDDLSGATMALFVNYGMQAAMMAGASLRLSGDVAGAISGWVERRLGCVCAWSMAAAAQSYPLTTATLETPVYERDGTLKIERATLSEEVVTKLASYLAAVQGLDILAAHERMRQFSTQFALHTGERRYTAKGKAGPLTHRFQLAVVNQDIAFAGVNALPSAQLGRMMRDALPYRSLFLSAQGDPIGVVVDQAAADDGQAGQLGVAADPWQTERLYVDGFTALAADARKAA